MAKMLSNYAINVLWQEPKNVIVPQFTDVSDALDADYANWVSLAYQLWIMGQNLPNNQFRPNDYVTRWEFATALSRMIYNTPDWVDTYYTPHLEKLKSIWVITNTNPKLVELRWYVMIMLMRTSK